MKHIKERSEFLNELKNSYSKFEVGKIYNHPKFGKFEVIELAKDSKTKVKFLEGSSKGDISYIAGWGDDGYIKESVTNESKLNLGLSTNNYPAGTIARYRLESDIINLRKVANLTKEPWAKYSRAFTDNELGFESGSDRRTAMTAIQKSFDSGRNDLREFSLNESLELNESDKFPSFNNGYAPGDYKYMKEMKALLSKIKGISEYNDMDTTTDVYIKSAPGYGEVDLTKDIQKALKGFDDNLDLDNISSNIGKPGNVSPNDQAKGIVTYKIPKKVDWWTLKRAAGDKPSNETTLTQDIVFSLLDRMAQVSTTQHELADTNWTSLADFLDAAEDHMKPAQYTKFVKDVQKKYPKMK